MPAMRALHKTDPKQELLAKVGDLSWLELKNNEILCAVYIRPNTITLKSGHTLHLSDGTTKEDEYQGKVSLVIKLGPLAYVSDEKNKFIEEQKVKVGDWVAHRASDGWQIVIFGEKGDKILCRMFGELDIRAVITQPDLVW